MIQIKDLKSKGWEYGINKVIQGDCLEGMKLIPDNSVDLVVTDPPYRVTSRGQAGNSGGMLQKTINKSGKVFLNNDIKISDWIDNVYRILKNNSHCYIMANHTNLIEYLNVITNANFKFIKTLIWDKGNKIMGQYYMSQFEYILFFRKGAGKKINYCGTSDIFRIQNKKQKIMSGNIHDTEKPNDLMQILIKNSSNENDIILDPFMGSWTTARACKDLNRNFIGFELEKEYCEIGEKRLEQLNLF